MPPATPYKFARASSLFLSFVFGIVGLSLGLNSLVKSNNDKDHLKKSAPAGTTVNIDDNDVFSAGVVVTVSSGLVALASFLAFPSLFSSRFSTARILSIQSAFLSFTTVFLFAALTPFTAFVASRQANVTAKIGNISVPDSVVKSVEQSLGVSPVYKHIEYLKNSAILPWFAVLFGITSTIVTILAARRAATAETSSEFGLNIGGKRYSEKNSAGSLDQQV